MEITLTTANLLPLTDDLLNSLSPLDADLSTMSRPMLANWIADAVRELPRLSGVEKLKMRQMITACKERVNEINGFEGSAMLARSNAQGYLYR